MGEDGTRRVYEHEVPDGDPQRLDLPSELVNLAVSPDGSEIVLEN